MNLSTLQPIESRAPAQPSRSVWRRATPKSGRWTWLTPNIDQSGKLPVSRRATPLPCYPW